MPYLEPLDALLLPPVDRVLSDVDDTLTHHGKLSARVFDALERLQRAHIRTILITAASAGWCHLMARMWAVDGVIGENGGLYFYRGLRDEITCHTWNTPATLTRKLDALRKVLLAQFPWLQPADDSAYRQTSLAFRRTGGANDESVLAACHELGASATLNSLWILCWPGTYDKLTMAKRLFERELCTPLEQCKARCLYVGDSQNDEPLFRFFPTSVGVATVTTHKLEHWPRWITRCAGGEGFVEVVDALLHSRA